MIILALVMPGAALIVAVTFASCWLSERSDSQKTNARNPLEPNAREYWDFAKKKDIPEIHNCGICGALDLRKNMDCFADEKLERGAYCHTRCIPNTKYDRRKKPRPERKPTKGKE